MAYSGRRRYKSRRDRLKTGLRNWRLGIIFFSIGLMLYLIKERVAIWDWLRTYF
ncbi:MAG: hypothetical protein AAF960_01740 [Bacteroidota bacterium]